MRLAVYLPYWLYLAILPLFVGEADRAREMSRERSRGQPGLPSRFVRQRSPGSSLTQMAGIFGFPVFEVRRCCFSPWSVAFQRTTGRRCLELLNLWPIRPFLSKTFNAIAQKRAMQKAKNGETTGMGNCNYDLGTPLSLEPSEEPGLDTPKVVTLEAPSGGAVNMHTIKGQVAVISGPAGQHRTNPSAPSPKSLGFRRRSVGCYGQAGGNRGCGGIPCEF